jgi:hypothetical protein
MIPGALERIEAEICEQFDWELRSEQCTSVASHIKSASSTMIVRTYWGVDY